MCFCVEVIRLDKNPWNNTATLSIIVNTQVCLPPFLLVHVRVFIHKPFCLHQKSPQTISARPYAQKVLDDSLVDTTRNLIFCAMLMLFAHAFDTICEWSSGPSSALFEEWSSWWSSDLQTWRISLPVSARFPAILRSLADPVTPTTRLRKHCTPRPCNTASHRGVGWLRRCGWQPKNVSFTYAGSLCNKKDFRELQ